MSPGARTTPEGTVASSRRVVSVDLAPTGAGCPPPLVSSTAMHAGAFKNDGMVNVSVQVVTPVPTITFPAELDPMMLAPAPQSAPSAGKVMVGTGVTTCTLTFTIPSFLNAPACMAVDETNGGGHPAPVGARSTETTLLLDATVPSGVVLAPGDIVSYICASS